ncbi:MAG: hypothetical protein ACRCTU_01890 [Zoogloea sp.]|uniref:hypothetical protein n=1 Tax=Zoogloea sp. TaxID=49181 RepID=UPI003F3FB3B0
MKPSPRPRRKLRLYSRLDAAFDDSDEDPRASLVNLVDVMLVFACGLLAALSANPAGAPIRQEVDQGQAIERPASAQDQQGQGLEPVGQVYRDAKTGQLILVEPGRKGE